MGSKEVQAVGRGSSLEQFRPEGDRETVGSLRDMSPESSFLKWVMWRMFRRWSKYLHDYVAEKRDDPRNESFGKMRGNRICVWRRGGCLSFVMDRGPRKTRHRQELCWCRCPHGARRTLACSPKVQSSLAIWGDWSATSPQYPDLQMLKSLT